MKFKYLLTALCLCTLGRAEATDYTKDLSVWFDKPNNLDKRAVWFGGCPDLRLGKNHVELPLRSQMNEDPAWESTSLPIGNGSLGANIMGSVEAERITFNEKTLWRGGPNTSGGADAYWNVNKNSAHYLDSIRRAFTDGDEEKAAFLTREHFNSEVPYDIDPNGPSHFGAYSVMGEFYIETGLSVIGLSDYQRILSLDKGMAVVRFEKDGVAYERNYFMSYPQNVMVVRFTASQGGRQNLRLSYMPNSISSGNVESQGADELVYKARLRNNQMEYIIRVKVQAKGGSLSNEKGKLTVTEADEVVFLVTADTDYKMNFNPDFDDPKTYVGVNPENTTRSWLDKAAAMGYNALYEDHEADYTALFNRVKLQLNPVTAEDSISLALPTDRRLERYRQGHSDFRLEETYYQFGRYLLIACSHPGNMPANLQGIWHNNVDGPWRVDYHNNINIQMNYWPACSANLYECVLPLVDFIRTLVKPGTVTARNYFGARGWTASISANIFGFTSPLYSHDMSWNFNPMAGPWLATHIWEYYDFTRDKHFLKETGYELIKNSANFTVDYLWKKPDGSFTAVPSTSPEHGPVDQGATFVHAVIREILTDAIEASKVLGIDVRERRRWKHVLENLAPYRIGRYGQLMEWSKDIDDPKDEHRHVNHLFGLHPGHTISPSTTPDLAKASRVVLEHRGDGATGWSMGWKLNLWARLHDGNHAYTLFGNLLKNGTLDNLWDTHAPFQIDGNFGGTSGITEMLMQSHMGFIHLLPALPDAWKCGHIAGLCARGNFELTFDWSEGELQTVSILSKSGGLRSLRYKNETLDFATRKGRIYNVAFNNGKMVQK